MDTCYKAVVVEDGERKLRMVEGKAGEVVVKVWSCPINPVDKYISSKVKGIGFEGAGEVVDVNDESNSSLIGKKVAFYNLAGTKDFEGSWRQYISVKVRNLIVYPHNVEYDQISSSFVNPQTVCYFIHELNKINHKCVIQDASCSSLARMFIKYCNKMKINIINIVRYDEEVKELQEFEAEYVFASESPDFNENLDYIIKDLNPTAFYDCIGGKFAKNIFSKMPKHSFIYIYGNLSEDEEICISNREMINSRKTITTINMNDFTDRILSDEERQAYFNIVSEDIINGGKIFGTKVIKAYPIENFKEAIEESNKVSGKGKIVIHPQFEI